MTKFPVWFKKEKVLRYVSELIGDVTLDDSLETPINNGNGSWIVRPRDVINLSLHPEIEYDDKKKDLFIPDTDGKRIYLDDWIK